MRVLGVIPARLGSTRLPHKPLQLLAGEPLIIRVIERVLDHGLVSELLVATDSSRIAEVVKRSGAKVMMTESSHPSGTDRVAEIASRPEFTGFEIVANIQGDEPFLPREALAGSLSRVESGDDIGTAAAPLSAEQVSDPARVKVVFDARGRALYFSRAAIPFRRDPTHSGQRLYWQHIGIYAFSRDAIQRWPRLPRSPAEQAEQLEQLRALDSGMTIGVARLEEAAQPGVDTIEDLRRAEAHWHDYQGQV
jgi:3-deoxy-manno-octulosonate cytidylyltransferase (CMP-KDO synthetase)